MGATDTYVTAGGVDITALVRQADVSIELGLNATPSSASFITDALQGPANGQVVEMQIGLPIVDPAPNLLFAGVEVVTESLYETITKNLSYHHTLKDFQYLLNRRYPIGQFSGPADQVILLMVAGFSDGFTTNNVQTGMPTITIAFDGSSDFATCMTNIMNLAQEGVVGSGFWGVDFYRDIHAGIT